MSRKKKRQIEPIEESEESKEVDTEDIYDDDQREEMLEDDEITAAEDGFMRGREVKQKQVRRLKRVGHEDTVSVELAEDEYRED